MINSRGSTDACIHHPSTHRLCPSCLQERGGARHGPPPAHRRASFCVSNMKINKAPSLALNWSIYVQWQSFGHTDEEICVQNTLHHHTTSPGAANLITSGRDWVQAFVCSDGMAEKGRKHQEWPSTNVLSIWGRSRGYFQLTWTLSTREKHQKRQELTGKGHAVKINPQLKSGHQTHTRNISSHIPPPVKHKEDKV